MSKVRVETRTKRTGIDGEWFPITGTSAGDKRPMDVLLRNEQGQAASLFNNVFGELSVASDIPRVQIDAVQGIRNRDHETFTATGGSVTLKSDHGGREFECATGTSSGGYGLIRSIRAVRYRAGQGTKLRWTARYSAPVALCAQRSGGVTSGCELAFGHNGSLGFGILYRTAGRLEERTLTISAAATGAETATITLNSVAYTVTLSSGTIPHNAFEVISDSDFGTTKAWFASQNGNTVKFVHQSVGTATGTYSFSSTGDAAGTFAQTTAGTAVVDTWVYQASWDNPTPFGTTALDPTKGNVYQVEFGYLGYAGIRYYVFDSTLQTFILVHTIKYANNYTVPHVDNPVFKLGWFAASLGSTTDVSVFGASAAGFISGPSIILRNPEAQSNTKTGVTTTLTNILSIRNSADFNGFVNLADIIPKLISVGVDGTKQAIVEVYINPTLGGEPNWAYHDVTNSHAEVDTAGTTVTGGQLLLAFDLARQDGDTINMSEYNTHLARNDVITIAAKATSATTDVSASITWLED